MILRRLRALIAMLVLVFPGYSWCQDELLDVPSFVKEMEKTAATVSSDEARWVRREFSDDMAGLESLGKASQVIEMVQSLQQARVNVSAGILGYLHGVSVLTRQGSWTRWGEWHHHLHTFLQASKRRNELQSYLERSAELHRSGLLWEAPSAVWVYRGGTLALDVDAEGSPVIVGKGGTLVCLSKGDSLRLLEAEGHVDIFTGRWVGSSATMPWERTSREGDLRAELGHHDIRLKGNSFLATDVTLKSNLFDAPLVGDLNAKVQNEPEIDRRTYPRFESRVGFLKIMDVLPGVSYEGGLAVRGSKLAGTGANGNMAMLEWTQADSVLVRCWSNEVQFSDEALAASHARMSLYLGEDSIHHPDIHVTYLEKSGLFRATRQEEGVGMQPFTDTYHAIDIEVEVLEWVLGGPVVTFRPLPNSTSEAAAFRSLDCFEEDVYNAMMGIDPVHPLSELYRFIKRRGVNTFYTDEYADFLRLPEEQARMQLIGLTNFGYVDLDIATRYCRVKPRAERHIDCKRGVRDFDVLALYSRPQGSVNATLSLNNKLLHLEGIGQVQVSEAQNVLIQPYGGQVALGKDRNFAFDGVINAGKFQLSGTGFEFKYEGFLIDINNAESLRIKVELDGMYDNYGQAATRWVTSVIEEVTGTLEIDNPSNKSGWRSDVFTQYPILTSEEISHVYYDAQSIQGGAYHRNRFNYAVDPFVIDSLDNFQNKDLRFDGELLSHGIVPDMVEPLRLMSDYSLGFTRSTPPEGVPLYRGAAHLVADLSLDGKGLHGPGTLEFLTSNIVGEDHVYLPDSTFGLTTTYRNAAVSGVLPQVDASIASFGLHPQAQRLDVRSTARDSLQFLGENVQLVGGMHMWADRMTGEGTFHFERAELSSRGFEMGEHLIDADVSAFTLVGTDLNEVAFGTDNVSAHVDFDVRRGDFTSIDGATLIELPAIRYECLMDEFSWYMDEDKLDLVNSLLEPEGMTFRELSDRTQSNFFSQDKDQDGLHFLSPRATYKVDEAFVHCQEVQSIAVADAEIKPADGEVIVRREARMDMLEGAEIFANDVSRYHRLYDAKVQIHGRLKYEGSATKTYRDGLGVEWPIRFHELSVDTAYRTVGHGRISAEDAFFLSPHFAYQGRVHLEAGREHLAFEGGAQMQFECEDMIPEWVEFEGVIDPVDVAIPVDSVVVELGRAHLGVGWVYNDGGMMSVYPSFFGKKPVRYDVSFLKPEGNLRYDKRKNRYVVCPDEKLRNGTLPGNLTELVLPSCEINQQGAASFPLPPSKLVRNTFIGDFYNERGGMKMRGGLVLDMPMPDVVANHLQQHIRASDKAEGLGAFATNYAAMQNELLGVDAANALSLDLTSLGEYKKSVPSQARHAMVFHGLNWEYDPFEDMWVTVGDIGVATMGEHNVWRSFPGKLAINRNDDLLHVYFHLDKNQWYYLEWNKRLGVVQVQASEMNLESEDRLEHKLAEVKGADKSFEVGKETLKWQWVSSKQLLRRRFVEKFREFD